MALVDYSDSSSGSDGEPKTKTVKVTPASTTTLPPLPAAFRDLYSSTVRTSSQDDPTLHAGRKRAVPHVAGNWPTHVYLDWTPEPDEHNSLAAVLKAAQKGSNDESSIHSLLRSDLGVQLPLHVSLSRPLALKTEQKDLFLDDLKAAVSATNVKAFKVSPADLTWHSNEDRTRWFLVLRLQRPKCDELRELLNSCNALAARFAQPLLYQTIAQPRDLSQDERAKSLQHDSFHISIAWTLQSQGEGLGPHPVHSQLADSQAVRHLLDKMTMEFSEVKVRIGQDVKSITLLRPRVLTAVST